MSSVLDSRLAETDDLFRRTVGEGRNGVFLYGAGFIGQWSVMYLEQIGIPVLGFIDSDETKWGTFIAGKQVFGPAAPEVTGARTILITSRHAVPAIKRSLTHLSANLMSIDAFVVHWEGKEKIEEAESLFSHDSGSLATFRAVLLAMLEGNTKPLEPVADSRPFFDRFGFFNRDGEIFVDAGAYVGDSLERFLWSVNGVFRHIHAFEPGRLQFKALETRVDRLISEWALRPDSISLVNKAIASESGDAYVSNSSHLIQTRLSKVGDCIDKSSAIPIVSLDEYFRDDKFTMLKVDVEGSEAQLLSGAADCVAKYHPRIALSVYHFPVDIFDLPRQCNIMNSDYVFALGHHSSQLMDTVLYCRDRDD